MVGELQLQGPVGWMRTRREKERWEEEEVQVEGRDESERRVEGQLAGRGQRYGSAGTRYEVRGSPAEMTPADEVARTLHRGLVLVLSWQRCRRHATKGPGSRGRPRAAST